MVGQNYEAVFSDLEYCYPGMKEGQPRPTLEQQCEIIEIGAIRYDMDPEGYEGRYDPARELETLRLLVNPFSIEQLPDFFKKLTGITYEDLEHGAIDFPPAFEQFVSFCDDSPVYVYARDEEVWRQNCGLHRIGFPFDKPFTRVKSLLPGWGVNPNTYSSGTLYKAAGLVMPEGHRVHGAVSDARSMAAAALHFSLNYGGITQ